MSKTIVATNPIRIREMIDINGNVIDPRTKQIIRKVETESILSTEETKKEDE
jgi:hypothetical protein